MTYYNEHDLKAAAWLEMLSISGEITTGDVDPRDVQKVRADDLKDYDRCHFFAGIGGWDYALRLAKWPVGEPVWTASLPCQPFSAAGKQRGTEDERHLWPVFRDLVEQCRPAILFGEQVSSKAALGRSSYTSKKRGVESLLDEAWASTPAELESAWFPTVHADLEDLGYIVGAGDIPAAGVGAPHIRQRLYWVAYLETGRRGQVNSVARGCGEGSGAQGSERPEHCCGAGGVAYRSSTGLEVEREQPAREELHPLVSGGPSGTSSVGRLPDAESTRREQRWASQLAASAGLSHRREQEHWDDVIYLPCADGKARPIKPGLEPLVDGVPGRVGLLRGYGNAIVPEVAAVFVRSVMEAVSC